MPSNPTLDDLTIINQLRNHEDQNLEVLLNRHSGIFHNVLHSILPSGSLAIEMKENYENIMYDAACKFDENKGSKFSSWLGQYTRYQTLDFLSEQGHILPMETDVLNIKIDESAEINKEKIIDENNLEIVRDILQQIQEPKMREVIQLRYFNDRKEVMPFTEIGEKMGFSRTTAKTWCDKFLTLAREKLQSQTICDAI